MQERSTPTDGVSEKPAEEPISLEVGNIESLSSFTVGLPKLSEFRGSAFAEPFRFEFDRSATKDDDLAQEVGARLSHLRSAFPEYAESKRLRLFISQFEELRGNFSAALTELESVFDGIQTETSSVMLARLHYSVGNPEVSQRIFRESAVKFDSADSWLACAYFALTRSLTADAEDLIDHALGSDPFHERALLLKGVLHLQSNRSRAAIAVFRKAWKSHPQSSTPLAYLAISYWSVGNEVRALSFLLQALEVDPTNKRWMRFLATMVGQIGKPWLATPAFERFLKYFPNDAGALEGLAFSYFEAWKQKRDRESLKKAWTVLRKKVGFGTNPRALNNLGVVEAELGDRDRALTLYRRAIEGSDSKDMAYPITNALGLYLHQQKIEDAIALLDVIDSAKISFPTHELAIRFDLQKSTCLQYKGQHLEAIGLLELALQEKEVPISWRLRTFNQMLCIEASFIMRSDNLIDLYGKTIGVLSSGGFDKSLKLQTWNNLAFTALQLNNLEEASGHISKMAQFLGKDPYVTATFGLYKLKTGLLSEGLELYNKAVGMIQGSRSKEEMKQRRDLEFGKALLQQGELRKAARILRRSIKYRFGIEAVSAQARKAQNNGDSHLEE
jgi:tetratricopeptide (TPR) repeat protein